MTQLKLPPEIPGRFSADLCPTLAGTFIEATLHRKPYDHTGVRILDVRQRREMKFRLHHYNHP